MGTPVVNPGERSSSLASRKSLKTQRPALGGAGRAGLRM